MSLVLLKLLGAGVLVPVLGASITYPIINSLKTTSKEFKLDSLDDFKNNCWVSMVGGDRGEYSGQNKKLLVCPSGSNSSIAKFYFYNTSFEDSRELPKEVKRLQKANNDDWNITVTLKDQGAEVIGVSNRSWEFLYKDDLSNVCSIVKEADGDYISCQGRDISTKLTKFNVSPGSELELD